MSLKSLNLEPRRKNNETKPNTENPITKLKNGSAANSNDSNSNETEQSTAMDIVTNIVPEIKEALPEVVIGITWPEEPLGKVNIYNMI